MKQQLFISAVGVYQPKVLSQLASSVHDYGATIVDCRMGLLGNETSITMLVSGSWDAIAKLEGMYSKLEKKLEMKVFMKRTEKRLPEKQRVPYSIEIVSIAKSDLINKVIEFLQKNEINVCEFYTNTYQNPYTDVTLLSINIIVSIPSGTSISLMRAEFLEFCDRLNLDAVMEPMKVF